MDWEGELQLVEPVPVEDDLCTALGLIEDLGFGARFVVAHRQTLYETRQQILVVKRKIVLPYDSIKPAIDMAGRFVARRAGRFAGRAFMRLVR
jgi:hypothetical protein